MERQHLLNALAEGQNLVLHFNKVYILIGLNDRPQNCVTVATIDSGKQYITAPDKIQRVVGKLELDYLTWNNKPEADSTDGLVPRPQRVLFEGPVTLKNGEVVAPGQAVKTVRGDIVIFKGFNPKGLKYPCIYESKGRRYKCASSFFLGKVG